MVNFSKVNARAGFNKSRIHPKPRKQSRRALEKPSNSDFNIFLIVYEECIQCKPNKSGKTVQQNIALDSFIYMNKCSKTSVKLKKDRTCWESSRKFMIWPSTGKVTIINVKPNVFHNNNLTQIMKGDF